MDDALDTELRQEVCAALANMAEGQETNEEKLMREALLDGASRVSISTMLRRRSMAEMDEDSNSSPRVMKTLDFDDTASNDDSESQYSEISCNTEDSYMTGTGTPPKPPIKRALSKPKISSSTSSMSKTSSYGSLSSSTSSRTRPSSIPVPRESTLRTRNTTTTTRPPVTTTASTTRSSSMKSKLPLKTTTASTSSADAKPRSRASTPSGSPTISSRKTVISDTASNSSSTSSRALPRTNSLPKSTKSTGSSSSLTSSPTPSPPMSVISPPTLIRGKSMSQVSVTNLFKIHFTSEDEIEAVLSQPPLRAIDSRGRVEQQDKYIRKLKYRLRELKMQRDAFSLACQGVERDLIEEHAATARAYAAAKQELANSAASAATLPLGAIAVAPVAVTPVTIAPQPSTMVSTTGEPSGPVAATPPPPTTTNTTANPPAPTSSLLLDEDLKTLDSNMQEFVRAAMERSTSQMVAKYQALLLDKEQAHEQQLQSLREHYTKSMSSSTADAWSTVSQLQAQCKALDAEKTNVTLQLTQLKIDHAALRDELHDFQERVRLQDEENTSAKTFWQKSTDMIKENRRLTEEIVHLSSQVAKAQEVIAAKEVSLAALQASMQDLEAEYKAVEGEKHAWNDRLTTVEAALQEERARREHFQVAQHQLTQDNTALYAQMMAIQAGCEARLEEMKAQYEQQRSAYAEEMKMLQTENRMISRHNGPRSPIVEDDKGELEKLSANFLEVRTQLAAQLEYVAELERQVHEGNILRRQMHNTIQELRGNVRVHVRLRPFLPSDGELTKMKTSCWSVDEDNSTVFNGKHRFTFDKLFGQTRGQEHIFNEVSDFIQSAIDGYHVCIFAYGQTGSGKTFTMQGGRRPEMRGIIPRAMSLIMGCCSTLQEQGWTYSLDVTFMEIYNETIRDLLSTDTSVKYNIRTDKNGKNYVENLRRYPISLAEGVEQIEHIMETAACNRSVEKTDMNAESSRSHSIFTLHLHGHREDEDDAEVDLLGSLSLVDLAGSERISRSGATGDRLKEAQAINKSLSALADVFGAIAKKQAHVPYRNSKLTYVLQPALSGDGKTLMMVNLSPTDASIDESLCSLRFAQQVNACELGSAQRNVKKDMREPRSQREVSPPPVTPPKPTRASALQPRLSLGPNVKLAITPKPKRAPGTRSIESS
ncbi:hypothetical protein LEN26_020170 [Aphanomyces euteiches]|nr:hypothetical protein LEN26_020170 [Aphanomyces euteiches]KAH9129496.1 hypothetical protein AeMF1_000473 [Aphanomyces euteiches]KAH9192068.1 hypothetical protein AeNC1_005953 [Aphanomyces euteiches]